MVFSTLSNLFSQQNKWKASIVSHTVINAIITVIMKSLIVSYFHIDCCQYWDFHYDHVSLPVEE